MQNSATVAGGMISWAPRVMAVRISSPCSSMCRLMFSMVTVASSTRMPTASARPPSVITLIVCPSSDSAIRELRTASGIDTVMMSVERQLPRKMRIMNAVSAAAISPSRTTAATEDFTKSDWSPTKVSVDSGRERGLNRRKPVLDAGDDVEGRGGADLEDRHQHALASVELDDVGLRRRSVVDVGNVAHEDDGAVDHLDRHVVEVGDRLGRIVEVEGEFVGADLLRPDRRDLVLPGERIADIIRGKTVGVQRLLIQIDLNLARRAAIGERKLRPRDGGELGADEVLGEVEQLDLGERVARQRELDDRNARGVIDQDDRRRRALRKLLEDRLRYRGHLRLRSIDVHVRLEVDLDDADAGQRLRLDVLDIVDGCGQHALVRGDDPTRHVVRREAGVAPDDRDDRNADIGKNVGRGPDRRERAEDHHQDRHNDEGVRTRES